jgi:creatinine amidohydrolase
MAKYHYAELSWPEIKRAVAERRVVLLPIGTTEQHGPHLPLAVDVLTASTVCEEAAKRIPEHVLVMPPIWYSFNEHHMDFPGTISIQPEHIIAYVTDVGVSLARHGFRKIVLINGHGSNVPFLDIAARNITNQTEAICAMAPWWTLVSQEIWEEVRQSQFPGGMSHACEAETSLMLAIRPDLVDMTKAVRDINLQPSRFLWNDLIRKSPVTFQDRWSRISKTGIIGDPTLATKEKGQRLLEAAVSALVAFVLEFKEREIRPYVDHH